MIFDFGRCFYETDKWEVTAYYDYKDKEQKDHYKCLLELFISNRIIKFEFIDKDCDDFLKSMSAAIRGKEKILCWHKDFDGDKEDDNIIECHCTGYVGTYSD